MPRMGKTEEDCIFKNNAQEIYFFVSNLWFCLFYVISLFSLSSISIEGESMAKQNEPVCRDTAPLSYGKTGNKNEQLVLEHCFKTRWKAMLRVYHPRIKLVLQQIRLL